jgi:hypothetical protein
MRPTKTESDMEYWSSAREYWTRKAEEYFLLDDREGERRCEARLFAADLCHQEAIGEIIVYTGRAKPGWA